MAAIISAVSNSMSMRSIFVLGGIFDLIIAKAASICCCVPYTEQSLNLRYLVGCRLMEMFTLHSSRIRRTVAPPLPTKNPTKVCANSKSYDCNDDSVLPPSELAGLEPLPESPESCDLLLHKLSGGLATGNARSVLFDNVVDVVDFFGVSFSPLVLAAAAAMVVDFFSIFDFFSVFVLFG